MLIKDNFDEALKFSESTNEFLSHYQIPPSPVNYSVIYLHVSKRNEKLSVELERHLQTYQEIDLILSKAYLKNIFQTLILLISKYLIPLKKL